MFDCKFVRKIAQVVAWAFSILPRTGSVDYKSNHHKVFNIVTAAIMMISLVLPSSVSANTQAQPQASIDSQVIEQLNVQGETTFWVVIREKADLRAAYSMNNWDARGRFVYQRLQAVANQSQAEIRSLLQSRGKKHRPFWIVNAIQVTADKATMQELGTRSDVVERPKLLLLDEPSLGLAPMIVEEVFRQIETINKAGMTILLVEQNAAMALRAAHRGYVIERGRVVTEGAAVRLLADPDIVAAYLGA